MRKGGGGHVEILFFFRKMVYFFVVHCGIDQAVWFKQISNKIQLLK